MTDRLNQSVNLNLPIIPSGNLDPNTFQELLAIYNALRILVQTVEEQLSQVTDIFDFAETGVTALYGMHSDYYKYAVPKFKVKGDLTVVKKFGCNGKAPQAAQVVTPVTTVVPAGGVGTAAGAWSSSADRDTAIAVINANTAAITEIQTLLKNIGLAA